MKVLSVIHDPTWTDSRIIDLLTEAGHVVQHCCPASGHELPEVGAHDAVVVNGGPVSVWQADEHPFMRREIDFVRAVVDAGVPFVGLCLGSQILAAAYGVTSAARPDGRVEYGFWPIEPTEAGRALFAGLDHVFQVHEEASVSVPSGGELLASSALFEVQAFRLRHAYGVQFHPDARQHDVAAWWDDNAATYGGRPGAQPLDHQIADAARHEAAIDRFTRRLLTAAGIAVVAPEIEEVSL